MEGSTQSTDKLERALNVFSLQKSPPLHIPLQAPAGQRRQWQALSWKGLFHGMAHWKPEVAECVLAFLPALQRALLMAARAQCPSPAR